MAPRELLIRQIILNPIDHHWLRNANDVIDGSERAPHWLDLLSLFFLLVPDRFTCKNNGVLYENDLIQIGVKSEFRQNLGRIALYFGNKTQFALQVIPTTNACYGGWYLFVARYNRRPSKRSTLRWRSMVGARFFKSFFFAQNFLESNATARGHRKKKRPRDVFVDSAFVVDIMWECWLTLNRWICRASLRRSARPANWPPRSSSR